MGTVINQITGEAITTDVSQAGKVTEGKKVALLDPEYDKRTAMDEALEEHPEVAAKEGVAGAGDEGPATIQDMLASARQQDQNVKADDAGKPLPKSEVTKPEKKAKEPTTVTPTLTPAASQPWNKTK